MLTFLLWWTLASFAFGAGYALVMLAARGRCASRDEATRQELEKWRRSEGLR